MHANLRMAAEKPNFLVLAWDVMDGIPVKKQNYLKKVLSQTRTKVPTNAIMHEWNQLMEPPMMFDSVSKILTTHKRKA